MIQGKQTNDTAEDREERFTEEYYHLSLEMINGIEGTAYGVMDELHDMEKLIESIGKTVEMAEKEFKKIMEAEYEAENGQLTPEILKNWHKKMYRQFTYKSLMMLIHTAFEKWGGKLLNLLEEEKRIVYTGDRRRSIFDVLKELACLDTRIQELTGKARAYNFLRNVMAHPDGYFDEKKAGDYDSFKKRMSKRSDLSIIKFNEPKGKYTHRVQIKQSTVLKDYITLIKQIFEVLIKGGAKLPIIQNN